MPTATPSLSSQTQGDSLIARVESLMQTPFDMLSKTDREERYELGWRRLRETLSCVPCYQKAAQTHPNGETCYWRDFWMSQVNLVYPSPSTATKA